MGTEGEEVGLKKELLWESTPPACRRAGFRGTWGAVPRPWLLPLAGRGCGGRGRLAEGRAGQREGARGRPLWGGGWTHVEPGEPEPAEAQPRMQMSPLCSAKLHWGWGGRTVWREGGSGMGTPARLGAGGEMGQGPGLCSHRPPACEGRWGSRAACLSSAAAHACPPPPWGHAVVPHTQQGVDMHRLSQSRAMSRAVPRQPPAPVTGVAASVQSRTCRSPARESSP